MTTYLNNCKNRDHLKLFGSDAFYDLDFVGTQANQARDLRPGDYCVVVSYLPSRNLIFKWYRFKGEREATDDGDKRCRVLFGEYIKEEEMPKTDAAANAYYRPFFNRNGDFKRASVI